MRLLSPKGPVRAKTVFPVLFQVVGMRDLRREACQSWMDSPQARPIFA